MMTQPKACHAATSISGDDDDDDDDDDGKEEEDDWVSVGPDPGVSPLLLLPPLLLPPLLVADVD